MKKGYNLLVLKALEFFIENPYEEIHLREFSRKMKISPNSAQRFLDLFLKEDFIKEERRVNLRYFKANLDNIVFKQIKIAYSLKKIKDLGIIKELEKNNFLSVVLFGSVAKGLDDENSDLDLVCIGLNKKIQSKIQEKLDRELNIHQFTLAEWKKQSKLNKAFYQDVISSGINLIGALPLIQNES